jgi:hypothetical protein
MVGPYIARLRAVRVDPPLVALVVLGFVAVAGFGYGDAGPFSPARRLLAADGRRAPVHHADRLAAGRRRRHVRPYAGGDRTVWIGPAEVLLRASVGVAEGDDGSPDALLHQADMAMYAMKQHRLLTH